MLNTNIEFFFGEKLNLDEKQNSRKKCIVEIFSFWKGKLILIIFLQTNLLCFLLVMVQIIPQNSKPHFFKDQKLHLLNIFKLLKGLRFLICGFCNIEMCETPKMLKKAKT